MLQSLLVMIAKSIRQVSTEAIMKKKQNDE